MKRMIRALLAAAVLATAMTCTAFAADTEFTSGSVDYNEETECYSVTADGVISGKEYVLLVVAGTPDDYDVTQDTILYINQAAAGSTITFDSFKPKTVTDAVVLLGGEFASGSSPKLLGTIKSIAPPEPEYVLGDVNGIGGVQIVDAQMALRLALGADLPAANFQAADINGNGTVQIVEAQRILKFALGDETAFDLT